jgi:hypothetical protein
LAEKPVAHPTDWPHSNRSNECAAFPFRVRYHNTPTPEQIAWRERFDELLTKWRTGLPSEKLQIQVELSDLVTELIASALGKKFKPALN